MFATGETMGLAKWIIDDTCLVFVLIAKKNLGEKFLFFISTILQIFARILIHEADHSHWLVVISLFIRSYVYKISGKMTACWGCVGWPSGSLMSPVLNTLYSAISSFNYIFFFENFQTFFTM